MKKKQQNVPFVEKQERYSKHTRNSKKTTHLAGTTAIHKFPVTKRPNRDREYRRRPHHKVDDDETDEVGENEYLAVNQDNEEINDEYNHYSYFNSSSTNIIYSFIWICLVQIALRI